MNKLILTSLSSMCAWACVCLQTSLKCVWQSAITQTDEDRLIEFQISSFFSYFDKVRANSSFLFCTLLTHSICGRGYRDTAG